MSTEPSLAVTRPERVALGRLWWAGPLTVIAAVVANSLVRALAVALFDISPEFGPMQPGSFIFFTIIGVTGAVLVFAAVGRWAKRPVRLFRIIAVAVLLLSFVPDFVLLATRPFPGTTTPAVGTLMVMHTVAAAVSVGLLERLTRQA